MSFSRLTRLMNDRRTALYGASSLLVVFGALAALGNHGLAAALLSGCGAGLSWITGRRAHGESS